MISTLIRPKCHSLSPQAQSPILPKILQNLITLKKHLPQLLPLSSSFNSPLPRLLSIQLLHLLLRWRRSPYPIPIRIQPGTQTRSVVLDPTLQRLPDTLSAWCAEAETTVGIPAVGGEVAQAGAGAVKVGGRVGVGEADLVGYGCFVGAGCV